MVDLMAPPDPCTLVTNLEYDINKDLTAILDHSKDWKLVARGYNQLYGLALETDERRLRNRYSQTEALLSELGIRGYSVGTLCEVLAHQQLYYALTLLSKPEPVKILEQPGNDDGLVYLPHSGGELQLECEAFGLPPPSFLWYKGDKELSDQTSKILTIKDFSSSDEGEYYCCISQDVEDDEPRQVYSRRTKVELQPIPPAISDQLLPEVNCREGEEVTFSCNVAAYPKPEYEWFKENVLLPGEDTNTLKVSVTAESEGSYRCYVKNKAGTVWSNTSKLSVVDHVPETKLSATVKVALLIGNDAYTKLDVLSSPSNDVETIASILKKIGFKVIALHNLTLREMKNAVRYFCKLLIEGAYAFFYFAGHGFNINGRFMLPVDAPGVKEYLRQHSLCDSEVTQCLMEKKPKLILIVLDMCLKIPNKCENPKIYEELGEVYDFSPLRNLILQYSTTPNMGAYEREGEHNSIYVSHLKNHLEKKLPILEILDIVHKEIAKESADAADMQMPLSCVNVVDKFYLTDPPVSDNLHTETEFQKLEALPKTGIIKFDRVDWKAWARVQPHRNCFHNGLDIIINNMAKWKVKVSENCKELRYLNYKQNDKVAITVLNLQKIGIPLMLEVKLKDPNTGTCVGSHTFELGNPLISQEHLWVNYDQMDQDIKNSVAVSENQLTGS